jgi:AhpD family alkylhydroperoxidase
MKPLEVHTLESAPAGSKPTLEKEKGAFGTVTNLTGILAESPAVVEGVSALFGLLLQHGSLSPIEKQVVALAAARENACHYCVAAHSTLAVAAKMDPVELRALREGQPLSNSKLETLRQFTLTLMKKQGWPSTEDLNSFYAAGFTRAQLLEVIAWIGLKVITNYTNHIAQTPVDSLFASQVWKTSKKAS